MVESDTLSLADEIYSELVAGLKTGDLNWTRFLAKYSASKGVLYDAIGRFFRDIEPEIRTLNETQGKLDEARLQLESLNQKMKEAGKVIQEKNQDIVGLEEKQNMLKKQIETLESNLAQKGETLERLQELEELDFGKEKLEALHTTLAEMGTKRGFKTEEVGNAFFVELKDYDTKIGFEQELQRLAAVTEAKKVEAEKWRTEAETCETRHKELQGTISAIRSLSKSGVKPAQVVSWNNALIGVGGVEELDEGLCRYGSIEKLLDAKERERERLDTKVAELNGKLYTLKERKAELKE
jgi:chromosome segregation ATPase